MPPQTPPRNLHLQQSYKHIMYGQHLGFSNFGSMKPYHKKAGTCTCVWSFEGSNPWGWLFKNWSMLGMHLSSYGCTQEVGRAWESMGEAFERHKVKPSASLASRVLSQLPKCIHNSIDTQLKHRPVLLEHCHFKSKQIKYRILLNHSEHFDWLNAITRFDRCTGMHLNIEI